MKNNKSNIFIIILFLIIVVFVLFFPKIYSFIENINLPKVEQKENKNNEEKEEITEELLESIHYPIMRNSVYDLNTYYSLDKFTVQDMSNNDILYNSSYKLTEEK